MTSKYVKGSYGSTASEEDFYKTLSLKCNLQIIAGFEQNDMVVTEEDISECEKHIDIIKSELSSWFERKVESLEYLGDEDDECG